MGILDTLGSYGSKALKTGVSKSVGSLFKGDLNNYFKSNEYPLVSFRFSVKIGDTEVAHFTEISGLTWQVETENVKIGGINHFQRQIITGAKFGNVTLKKGYLIADSEFLKWIVSQFPFQRKGWGRRNVTIDILGRYGNSPLVTIILYNAFVVKLELPSLKSTDNSIAIESIEIAYDYFQVEKTESIAVYNLGF